MEPQQEVEVIPPLWCDEMPQTLQRGLNAKGPLTELFVANPSAVPWRKRRKIEKESSRK